MTKASQQEGECGIITYEHGHAFCYIRALEQLEQGLSQQTPGTEVSYLLRDKSRHPRQLRRELTRIEGEYGRANVGAVKIKLFPAEDGWIIRVTVGVHLRGERRSR